MSPPSRILIVEDQEVLGENLKNYLGRSASDVRLAPDAEHALEILESFRPDVVVLDYGLPGMNGVETYDEIIRRSAHQLGCVMITGFPRERVAPSANERGIRHVLSKPFGLSELRKLVNLSAEEACGGPQVPFVRCSETRRAGERRSLSPRGSLPATAKDGSVVEIERRRGESRCHFKRRRAA